jgi:hypothetical protein
MKLDNGNFDNDVKENIEKALADKKRTYYK